MRLPRVGRMVVVAAGLGACFVWIRWGLEDASPLWFAALRGLLAGAALFLVAALLRRPLPPRSTWFAIASVALFNVTLAYAAMFVATGGVAGSVATVLANAQPLLIILPAWALYGERPSIRILTGLFLGFAGLSLLTLGAGEVGGAVLALAAASALTVGTLLARRLSGVDVMMFSALQLLIGAVLLAVWASFADWPPKVAWTPGFIGSLAFLALIGTALTSVIWFTELHRASLVSLSAWLMLTPVFGVLFGWLLVGEQLSLLQAGGIALVVASLAVVVSRHAPGNASARRPGRQV